MSSQIFAERSTLPFEVQEAQIQFAKLSIIAKKKYDSSIHSILFCKKTIQQQNFECLNEKNQLIDQKRKYIQYIRKNFKDKIPEDFQSYQKLKNRLREKTQENIFQEQKKIKQSKKTQAKPSQKNKTSKQQKQNKKSNQIQNQLYSEKESQQDLQIEFKEDLQNQYDD